MTEKYNKVEQKKRFERNWVSYILGFEDMTTENDEWSTSDRDLEAWMYGCDMSKPFLSKGDKIKVKRYRRDEYKR